MFDEANYSKGSLSYNWIIKQIIEIQNRIIRSELNKKITSSVLPSHIVEYIYKFLINNYFGINKIIEKF